MSKSKAELELIVASKAAALAFDNLTSKMNSMMNQMEKKVEQLNKQVEKQAKGEEKAAKETEKHAKAVEQVGYQSRRTTQEAEKTGKQFDLWGKSLGQVQSRAIAFFTGMLSIRGLVGVIRQDIDNMVRQRDEASQRSFPLEARLASFRDILPLAGRSGDEGIRIEDIARKVRSAPAPEEALSAYMSAYSAASGTKKSAIETVDWLLQNKPHLFQTGEAAGVAEGLVGAEAMGAFPKDMPVAQRFELIQQGVSAARIAGERPQSQFAKDLLPGIASLVQQGFSFQDATAIAAELGTLGGDAGGAMTRTQLSKFGVQATSIFATEAAQSGLTKGGQQLRGMDMLKFLAGEDVGLDKPEMAGEVRQKLLRRFVGAMNLGPEETAKVLQELKSGRKKMKDEWEKEIQSDIEGRSHMKFILSELINPKSEYYQRLQVTRAAMPSMEELPKLVDQRQAMPKSRVLEAGLIAEEMRSRRQLDIDEAFTGKLSEIVRESTEKAPWGVRNLQRFDFYMRPGATPEEQLQKARRVVEFELSEWRGQRTSIQAGLREREIDRLTETLNDLNELLKNMQQTRNNPVKVVPANPVGQPQFSPPIQGAAK